MSTQPRKPFAPGGTSAIAERDPASGRRPAGRASGSGDEPEQRGLRPLAFRIAGVAGDSLFALPLVVLVGGLLLIPTLIGLSRAFYDWNPGYASPFVGLRNFTDLAASPTFRQIMKNEGVFLLGVPIWVLVPLALAVLLHERVALAGVWRTIFFFPSVLSPAIVGILFRGVLAPEGLLNGMLKSVGLGVLTQHWIDDAALVKPVLIAVLLWASLGTGVVMFSAALSSVNPELFEAAEIDGASWVQRLRYVVLPSIKHVVLLYTVLQVVSVFLFFFGWIYVLTAGGPGYASTTLDYDVYQNAFSYGHFGLASAESIYLLMIVAVVLTLGWSLTRLRRTT